VSTLTALNPEAVTKPDYLDVRPALWSK